MPVIPPKISEIKVDRSDNPESVAPHPERVPTALPPKPPAICAAEVLDKETRALTLNTVSYMVIVLISESAFPRTTVFKT